MAVYFFYGDEDYNIDLELNKMRSKLNPDFISMNYQILDNPDYQTLIQALRTLPMMFGEMLIIVNIEMYFSGNKKSFEDSELEDIKNALDNNPNGLNIVFVVKLNREENKKLDSRRKLYKILTKFNSKEFPVIKSYKTDEIKLWIKNRAKTKDLTFKDDALDLFIEYLGNNLRLYDSEMDKLVLASHPQKTVTKEMIEDICISSQDLFYFADLIMKGSKEKALIELKKLLDKKHPLELLSAIQTMIRKWILIKTKPINSAELIKLTGMPDYLIKKTSMKLKNTKVSDLVELKENLFEVEYKIKSANSVDMISEVECAIIR